MVGQRLGVKEVKYHLYGSAGDLPGFRALCSLLPGPALGDGAIQCVFSNE